MKNFFMLLLLLSWKLASADSTNIEILCFTSGGEKPVSFELRIYYDQYSKWRGAMVKYSKSDRPISLVLDGSKIEKTGQNVPYEETTEWVEVVNSRINGFYELNTQGTHINSMRYKSRGKKLDFFLDSNKEFSIERGCY